jgi:hypothetical protein
MIFLSTFVEVLQFLAFVNANSNFFYSILVSFEFWKFLSDSMKAMVKDNKSILQLPEFLFLSLLNIFGVPIV